MMQTALRTAGIWIEEDHILLESLADKEVWGIPGGRLEPNESAEAGCLREYREELGLEMQVDGLALLHESFWRAGNGESRVTRTDSAPITVRSATLLRPTSSAVRPAHPQDFREWITLP